MKKTTLLAIGVISLLVLVAIGLAVSRRHRQPAPVSSSPNPAQTAPAVPVY